MVSGGHHERWEAKPLQYYVKYCERVWLDLRAHCETETITRWHAARDVSPWCAACCGTLRSGTLLAFSGGASGLMDVADTTTWQTSCACDKKSLICVKASRGKTTMYNHVQ